MSKITRLPTAAAEPVKQIQDERTYLEKFLADDTRRTGAFDWSTVTRSIIRDETGAYIKSLDDPVSFTPAGTLQLRTFFGQFGLRRMPATYAQLEANYQYCTLLKNDAYWANTPSKDAIFEAARQRFGDDYIAAVELLLAGDIEALAAFHEQKGTFEKNSTDPFLLSDADVTR